MNSYHVFCIHSDHLCDKLYLPYPPGSSALWALSLVTNGAELDLSRTLVVIRDEQVTEVSMPMLGYGHDIHIMHNTKVCCKFRVACLFQARALTPPTGKTGR